MKVCTIAFGVLVACAAALAVEHGHIIDALQPRPQARELIFIEPVQAEGHNRQKRGLLLGALGAGALGLGAVGLGAGLIGAKAGFIGGALAGSALSKGYGRSYGGYGGYSHGGGYGGYSDGYGGYGGYSSYPSYYSSW